MHTKALLILLVLSGVLALAACGGTQAEQTQAPQPTHAAPAKPPSSEEDAGSETAHAAHSAAASEPVEVKVVISIPGKGQVKGTFTITSSAEDGRQVATDQPTGSTVVLKPGFYTIAATTKEVVGSPTVTLEDEEIPAGEKQITKTVELPVGTVTLKTMKGERCESLRLRIRQGSGEWIESKSLKTCEPMTLMAGTWQSEVILDKKHVFPVEFYVNSGGVSSSPVDLPKPGDNP